MYYFCKSFRKKTFLTRICSWKLLRVTKSYVIAFGLLGVCLSLFDILKILQAGSTLPCSLWRKRIRTGRIVSAERERDLKLITLILSLEYYFLLVWGTITNNRMYLLPWLYFYGITIALEFLIFVLRLYAVGLEYNKRALLLSMFVICNWLAIHCIYQKKTGCHSV